MKLLELPLKGAYILEPEKLTDERGFFARTFCQKDFKEKNLCDHFVQCNVSFNKLKGTLRGIHYQIEPHQEIKLVRCTKGSIYDVIVDLRPDSATFKQSLGLELTSGSHKILYIPEGFGHGFITLENDTEIFYQMSEFFQPTCARGLRWNDPSLNIVWPYKIQVISEKDKNYPNFAL